MTFNLWGLQRVGNESYRPLVVVQIDFKNKLVMWRG